MITRRLLLGSPLAVIVRGQSRIDRARIDAIAREELTTQPMPGLGVCIAFGGESYTQGYGVRSLRGGRPVTPRTIFATGSLTKSFTALAAAMLVAENKLDWDRPAREYLPWFKMFDPTAAQINVRDMLCHRSGLPRYDFLRFALQLDRAELVRRIQFLPPTEGFRAKWQYNNLMYCAAGLVTAQIAGMAWEDLIERRIFSLLAMENSNVRVAESRESEDFALPHELTDRKPREVEFYDYQKFGVGPNGAVNTTADDLLKYLRFHLAGGPLCEQLHYPQMVVNRANTYGLGWWIHNVDGVLSHGGSITGFRAHAVVDRPRNLAVGILTNGPANTGRIASRILLALTGREAPPAETPPPQRQPSAASPTAPPAPATRPLTEFTGSYEHPAFGVCEVNGSGGKLSIKFPMYSSALTHVRADQFRTSDRREVEFLAESRDLSFRVEPAAAMLRFARVR